jgi:hypothetical protein
LFVLLAILAAVRGVGMIELGMAIDLGNVSLTESFASLTPGLLYRQGLSGRPRACRRPDRDLRAGEDRLPGWWPVRR